jgi:predicted GIY-YIG superfamily endonuclease
MARWESRTFFVYIMGSKFGVLYIGVTNNLERRVKEHRQGLIPSVRESGRGNRSRETNQRMEGGKEARPDSFDES